MTKQVKVGIRITPVPQIEFFGLDEVNSLIAAGGRVTSIQQGDAIITKTGESQSSTHMVLSGCEMRVLIDLP